jgi:hypothetical protein
MTSLPSEMSLAVYPGLPGAAALVPPYADEYLFKKEIPSKN